ncbi:MAG: hypothetical protein NTV22_15245 [bacterium]|nr:hypothetical protein [bacterium]
MLTEKLYEIVFGLEMLCDGIDDARGLIHDTPMLPREHRVTALQLLDELRPDNLRELAGELDSLSTQIGDKP